jgi:hypothetical protein
MTPHTEAVSPAVAPRGCLYLQSETSIARLGYWILVSRMRCLLLDSSQQCLGGGISSHRGLFASAMPETRGRRRRAVPPQAVAQTDDLSSTWRSSRAVRLRGSPGSVVSEAAGGVAGGRHPRGPRGLVGLEEWCWGLGGASAPSAGGIWREHDTTSWAAGLDAQCGASHAISVRRTSACGSVARTRQSKAPPRP